jgi:hypothetical protein
MKAIIFATSIKEGKNSNTRAWCVELDNAFKQKGYQSEIITLRDFDYEASTGKDLLHEEMNKLYDANFIMFTSPCNFSNMTFYLQNLLDRFSFAYTKSKEKGIDLFENKRFEFLPFFGACTNQAYVDPNTDWQAYEGKMFPNGKASYPYLGYKHNVNVYKTLNFIKPLGLLNLRVNSYNPLAPFGPNRLNTEGHPQTLSTINRIIRKIKTLGLDTQDPTPKCTPEEFIECFRSEVDHNFGRGLTLSVEALSYESAQEHIKALHSNNCLPEHTRYQAIVAMKDRAVRAGLYEVAELYYNEQARHNIDWYDEYSTEYLNKNGNMRPNNY